MEVRDRVLVRLNGDWVPGRITGCNDRLFWVRLYRPTQGVRDLAYGRPEIIEGADDWIQPLPWYRFPRPRWPQVYPDPHAWWVGYARGEHYHYLCLLPSLVIRWRRR